MNSERVLGLLVGWSFLGICGLCEARLVTVRFTADVVKVEDQCGVLQGRVKLHDTMRGWYTYDTSAPDQDPSCSSGRYEFLSPPCGITLEVGGYVFQSDPSGVRLEVRTRNDVGDMRGLLDALYLESYANIMLDGDIAISSVSIKSISVALEDWLEIPDHPRLGLLSDKLPACAPALSDWPVYPAPKSNYPPQRGVYIGGLVLGEDPRRTGRSVFLTIEARLISTELVSEPPRLIYVDDDALGRSDGSSWQDAFAYLQDALASARGSDQPVEIRVAGGVYRPDRGKGQVLGDRRACFQLMNQVSLMGGYAGLTGPDPNVRNPRMYRSVLSGDLNGDDLPGYRNRADNSYHVLCATGTDESAVLDGFVIVSGHADGLDTGPNAAGMAVASCVAEQSRPNIVGGGMYLQDSRAVIANCVFRDNYASDRGGAIYISSGPPRITGCTFSGNHAGSAGGALCDNSEEGVLLRWCLLEGNLAGLGAGVFLGPSRGYAPWFVSCTFAGNRATQGTVIDYSEPLYHRGSGFNCILWDNGQELDLYIRFRFTYSDLPGGRGRGNMDTDPLFARPGYWDPNGTPDDPYDDIWVDGDYHLKSQAGRWDPASQAWVKDDVTSPCIDAGDPNSPIGLEPFPNGGRINMGAYGGTQEASKSYFGGPTCETIVSGDIDGDCKVDLHDLAILASHWLEGW